MAYDASIISAVMMIERHLFVFNVLGVLLAYHKKYRSCDLIFYCNGVALQV